MAVGSRARIGVLIVRNGTALFTDALAEALRAADEVRLVSRPLTHDAALEFCRRHRPDAVLVDVTSTSAKSVRLLVRSIRGACDGAPVVLLADEVIDDAFFVAGIEGGASGIVDASNRIDEVVKVVKAALAGEHLVDRERLASAVEAAANQRERERRRLEVLGLLSVREREVLAKLSQGMRNSEIADHLTISPRTVEKHVHEILRKLRVGSRLAAVALLSELGGSDTEGRRGTA